MDLKAGIKTTEFWLSLLAFLLGVFLSAGVLPDSHWAVRLGGALMSGLVALGYGFGRAKLKSGSDGGGLFGVLLLLAALSIPGCVCSTPRACLATCLTASGAASELAVPAIQKVCEAKIKGCKTPETCPAYLSCLDALDSWSSGMSGARQIMQQLNEELSEIGVQ